jgi:hypothetical protein
MRAVADDLPREVSRATVNIGGFDIEFVHLDNGQRIITAESMERFMAFLHGEAAMKNVTPEADNG